MLGKQEVFDKVAVHLLTQNAKSMYKTEHEIRCAYRADDGKCKCAVGCLIEDQYYNIDLEGKGPYFGPVTRALEASGVDISIDMLNFLAELQNIHDNTPVEAWPHYLQASAIKHALSTEALNPWLKPS